MEEEISKAKVTKRYSIIQGWTIIQAMSILFSTRLQECCIMFPLQFHLLQIQQKII